MMAEENRNAPRRSLRLALTEVWFNETITPQTPGKQITNNPDEMIIIQRGSRKKPITWSPIEDVFPPQNSTGNNREEAPYLTPEKPPKRKSDVNPKLRRRLLMSPTKNATSAYLGDIIARKLRALPARQPKLD